MKEFRGAIKWAVALFFLVSVVFLAMATFASSDEFPSCNVGQKTYTGSTLTVINEDCTITTSLYGGPIAFFNSTSNQYEPINTEIQNTTITISGREYIFGVDKGIYSAYWRELSSDVSNRPVAMIKDNYVFTLAPQDFITFDPHKSGNQGRVGNRVQSTALVSENNATYPGQYSQIGSSDDFADLSFLYVSSLIKEDLVISDKDYAWERFQSQVDEEDFNITNMIFGTVIRAYANNDDSDNQTLGIFYGNDKINFKQFGLSANGEFTTTERVDFTDENNETIYYIPVLYARDSDGNILNDIILNKTISMTAFGNLRVDILTPMTWLNDTNTIYPIFIDPTVSLQDADSEVLEDAYNYEGNPDANEGDAIVNNMGNGHASNLYYESFVKFYLDPAQIDSGVTITNAVMGMVISSNTISNPVSVWVNNVSNQTWQESTITWNAKPTAENIVNQTSWDGSYPEANDKVDFNVTSFVVSEHGAGNTNVSFHMNTSTLAPVQLLSFFTKDYTTDPSVGPYLNVTYIGAPPLFTQGTNSTQPNDIDGIVNYMTTITPLINATDPEGFAIESVNFTLVFPNGTAVYSQINGSQDNDQWNGTSYIVKVNGTYNISITTVNDVGFYNSTQWLFDIEYYQPFIFGNETTTGKSNESHYESNVTLYANITDGDSDAIQYANFTMVHPNGTTIFGPLNGTRDNGDQWHSPQSHFIKTNGTYTIYVNATDDVGVNNSLTYYINATYGTANVTSDDGDLDHVGSLQAGMDEVFNLTASHTGSLNNTFSFSFSSNFTNITQINTTIGSFSIVNVSNSSSRTDIQINVSVNDTTINATYIGYINWNTTNDDGDMLNNGSIEINITVSALSANVDILETTFSVAKAYDVESTKTFNLNNTGNYNATLCNLTLSATVENLVGTANATNFDINQSEPVTIEITLSTSNEGDDDSASVSLQCASTPGGSLDTDSITGSISVSGQDNPGGSGGGTGGGGGGDQPAQCGNGICEGPAENNLTCFQDCAGLRFHLSAEEYTFPAAPGSSIICQAKFENVCTEEPIGCGITIINDVDSDLLVDVKIKQIVDESSEWALLVDENDEMVKQLTVDVPALSSREVKVAVDIPTGVSDGPRRFDVVFSEPSGEILFSYNIDVSQTQGAIFGFAGSYIFGTICPGGIPVPLWQIWLLISVVGIIGIAVYSRKGKITRRRRKA